MLRTTPFLLFTGDCAAAMTFYHRIFGGDLTLTRTGDTPMREQFPPEKHDLIINAHLRGEGVELSATDWHADYLEPRPGNTFSIYLTGGPEEELSRVFDELSEEADRDQRTFVPLAAMPFGSYGQLTDRFGVSWVFVGSN